MHVDRYVEVAINHLIAESKLKKFTVGVVSDRGECG
jgi:hypothetical protein